MSLWMVAAIFAAAMIWQFAIKPLLSRGATPAKPEREDPGEDEESDGKPSSKPEQDFGEGAPPAPQPRIIEGPNVRIVDLRPLPEDEVRVGRFGVTSAVVQAQPPVGCQLFVISPPTAEAWLSMSDLALSLVLNRLRQMRKAAAGKAMLHVAGAAESPAAEERFAAAGLEVARDLVVVGSERSVGLAEALALPQPAPGTLPQRPVLPYTLHSWGLVGREVVFEIDRAVFVDLRRASPEALANLTAFDHVDKALGNLRRGADNDRLIIWCVAPWIFDRWREREDDVVSRIEVWTKRLGGPRHRLAIIDGTGEEPLVPRLAALGLRPLSEKCQMKTEGRIFRVPFTTLLDDIAGHEAALAYASPAAK